MSAGDILYEMVFQDDDYEASVAKMTIEENKMSDEKNFPQEIGETFLEAFGKPTDEEWAKMDTKQRIEAVANVHREKREFERQAKGFQFEAALMRREALREELRECRHAIRYGTWHNAETEDHFVMVELHAIKKVVEFIECLDEPTGEEE